MSFQLFDQWVLFESLLDPLLSLNDKKKSTFTNYSVIALSIYCMNSKTKCWFFESVLSSPKFYSSGIWIDLYNEKIKFISLINKNMCFIILQTLAPRSGRLSGSWLRRLGAQASWSSRPHCGELMCSNYCIRAICSYLFLVINIARRYSFTHWKHMYMALK